MQNEESLNLLNQKPGNVKNALVQKLSKQWPQTIKQLDHALKREFGMDVTYQAVHKAMSQLEDEKVVEKVKEGFQLHPEWITTITKLSNQISQAYANNQVLDFEKESIQLTFPNWLSVGKFAAFRFATEYPNPENKTGVCNWIHVWPVVGLGSEEVELLQKYYFKGNYYSLCPNDTPLDRAMAEWLNKIGKKCKTGINIQLDHDYIIKGDHVLQIYYPSEFLEDMNKIYTETKSVDKLDYKKMTELVNRKVNIPAVILKNPALTEQLRRLTNKTIEKNKINQSSQK